MLEMCLGGWGRLSTGQKAAASVENGGDVFFDDLDRFHLGLAVVVVVENDIGDDLP